jgi:hypothetical protein
MERYRWWRTFEGSLGAVADRRRRRFGEGDAVRLLKYWAISAWSILDFRNS